jgi:serine/threonine protein phosphatase PrpC
MTSYGAQTATGTRHKTNEDSLGEAPRDGVWLVADGMGGHAAGDAASQIVRDTMLRETGSGASLFQAIEASHQEVINCAERDAKKTGMGSTIAALRIEQDEAKVAWVGDSRVYLFRDGKLSRLTTDHSYVQYLLQQGQISEDEVETHPQRNVLTQTLGFDEPKPDSAVCELQPDDWLLLCSDGLTVEVTDPEIEAIMEAAYSAQQAAADLVAKVVERHGKDDSSAIVVHYQVRSNAWAAVVIGVLAGLIAFLTALWVKSS